MTQVLILMGSDSDAAVMSAAGDVLTELGITRDRRHQGDRRRNGFISGLQLFASIPYALAEGVRNRRRAK